VLLYIFALIGAESRRCVEIGVGVGVECNTANLILNHRWSGLLTEANEDNVRYGRDFYGQHRLSYVRPPTFLQAAATPQNVNDLVADAGFAGDIDLLSIDVDGHDYWLFGALTGLRAARGHHRVPRRARA
jgi:hypothetical protein